ncbi:MAG: FISUMP domain-containing protein [Bacteroidota bacterium]
MKKLIFLAILTTGFFFTLLSQDIVKQVKENDNVVLKLGSHTGDIQWQKSTDNSTWTDLSGKTVDSLEITVTEEAYYRASVTVGSCDAFISEVAWLKLTVPTDSVTDIDGNTYPVKTYGTQTWMLENLKTTRFNSGELIGTLDDVEVDGTDLSQWAYANNESNVATYGRLYTWYTASDERGICPSGWSFPSKSDWEKLVTYLGDNGFHCDENTNTVAKAMASTTNWSSSNGVHGDCAVGENPETNNASGFNGMAGGFRDCYDNAFVDKKQYAYWWTATNSNAGNANAHCAQLVKDLTGLRFLGLFKNSAASIRCVKGGPEPVKHSLNISVSQSNVDQCLSTSASASSKDAVETLNISPNPVKGILHIKGAREIQNVKVSDMTGKTLINLGGSGFNKQVNLSSFGNGIYILHIKEQDGTVSMHKIIKE